MAKEKLLVTRCAALLSAIGLAMAAAAGCDPSMFNPDPTNDPPTQNPGPGGGGDADRDDEKRLAGVWHCDGDDRDLLGYFLQLEYYSGRTVHTEYLVLDEDGSARITFRDPELNIVDEMHTAFARIGDGSFVIDDEANINASRLQLMRYELIGDDELEIATTDGRKIHFTRQEAIAPDREPKPLALAQSFAVPMREPDSNAGLAYDGAMLWFKDDDDDKTHPLDPANGNLGTPITFASEWKYVHAAQADDFWLSSRSNNHFKAQRRTRADVLVDEVDLKDLTGEDCYVEAIAATTGSPLTWFYVEAADSDSQKLIAVNTDAEPDVLIKSVPFNMYVESMAWDGKHLYVQSYLANNLLAKLDGETLKAVETYVLPVEFVYWDAIATVGDDFYAVGYDYPRDQGLLARLTRPD